MNNVRLPKYYAYRNGDLKVVEESRSGGFFTALSDYVLKYKGVVYACMMSEKLEAVHVRVDNKITRDKCRGSKYVQSVVGDCFRSAKDDLENGRLVLFSGTACQINGFMRFLSKKYENLLTLDILCHAVPSPKVFEEFKNYMETKFKEECVAVDFRNKRKFGWGADVMSFFTKNHSFDTQSYSDFFWGGLSIRPSCFHCRYKKIDRGEVDYTIGDFWGIGRCCPQMNDDRGNNLIICNSLKGYEVLGKISEGSWLHEVREDDVMQSPLQGNLRYNSKRPEFFRDLKCMELSSVVRKWRSPKPKYRYMKQQLKAIYYNFKKIWKI